jgi:hypothetical protein
MNTLIKKPSSRKRAIRKDGRILQNPDGLKLVPTELISSRSNLSNVTDLFRDNADFINYGISAMTYPF